MRKRAFSLIGRFALMAAVCLSTPSLGAYAAIPGDAAASVPADDGAGKSRTVSGIVRDDKGAELVGVSIIVKGTNIGMTSGADGKFAFKISGAVKDPVLVFSFLGLKTEEAKAGANLSIVMKEDPNSIENAVVTGYATIRKESFTGTSTTVSREEILKVSPTNIMKAISVYEPSMRLVTNNEMGSDPNSLPEYYIRGRSGVSEISQLDQVTGNVDEFTLKNNPSAPVFILDGFETDIQTVTDLDPNRVASVTVLKDAAATAVYGTRAANGVIVIETTTPAPGAIRVNYSANMAVTTPDLSSYDLMNSKEILQAEWLADLYAREVGESNWQEYSAAGLTNYMDRMNAVTGGFNTDWISKPVRNKVTHKHTLSIDGGTNELRWGADINFADNGGVMKGSERKTYGAALKIDYNWKGLRISNKFTFSHLDSQNSPYGSFQTYYRMKPYLNPIDEETGAYTKIFRITRFQRRDSGSIGTNVQNPLYEATLGSFDTSKYTSFTDNLGVNWHITPYLTARGQFSATFKVTDNDKYTDPMSGKFIDQKDPLQRGTYKDNDIRNISWSATGQLSYFRTIEDHNINANLGVEAAQNLSNSFTANYIGFLDGVTPSPSNAIGLVNNPLYTDSMTRRAGVYLQANYTYKDIYLLDLSDRYEGSSAFGANNKMGNFYSGGVGLNLHKYGFMQNAGVFDLFKVKATYGQTGKANFSPYQARTTYSILYDQPYVDMYGMTLKALGNEDLLWEKVNKLDVGTEISIFDNLVHLTFDWYRETTSDQVQDVALPSSSGFKTYKGNMGKTRNQGVDLKLNVRAFSNRDWDVYLFLNGNHNTNRIVELGEALEAYNAKVDAHLATQRNVTSVSGVDDLAQYAVAFTKYEVGNSLSAIYGMKSLGIDPNTGMELFEKRDGTVTYAWEASEQQCIGDADPKVRGNFGFNVRWKNWTLFSSFQYHFGGQAYNYTLRDIENLYFEAYSGDRRALYERWQKPGDVTTLKAIDDRTKLTRSTSRFVQDDNTLTFNNISLQYTFDRNLVRKWGLSGLRVNASTTDLLYLSSIKRERGTTYPYARTFNLGCILTF